MTATYTPFATDKDRVRFHINDTDIEAPRFGDAEIEAVIVEAGTWQKAVILLLKNLIMKLSQPDFKADWLQVTDYKSAREGYQSMLRDKLGEFGLQTRGKISGRGQPVYRGDSLLDGPPDW